MKIYETLKTAIAALNSNKVRSSLTMLGVIIGVAAVILLISIGRGIQNYITDQFEQLGSNLVFVAPGRVNFGRDPAEALTRNSLSEKHITLIERHASDYVEKTTPWVSVGLDVQYKTKDFYASLNAFNEHGFEMFSYKIESGRSFNRSEVRAKSKVVIIGPKPTEELFNTENPVGRKVKINDETFEVIGVFKEKGQSYDEGVLIPYTTAQSVFDIENFSNITVKVSNAQEIDRAMAQIDRALRRDLKSDEYSVLSPEDILSSIQNILGILTLGLGAIAGISLLVGGIGIMNIMLVSVTERTREIGLRKAVGATPGDIAGQFLMESTLLSVGGGIMGIIMGWLGSFGARRFLRTEVPWWAVLLAFSFAVLVGIIFGTYPAIKASRKNSIDALRYE